MSRALLAIGFLCTWVSAVAGPSCPSDFSQFLNQMGTDRSFQERHIRYPLRYISKEGTECYPDCPIVERGLTHQKIRALAEPIFPLRATQLAIPLDVTAEATRNAATVRMNKPDSDAHSFEYRFVRSKSCWLLVAVQDHSL